MADISYDPDDGIEYEDGEAPDLGGGDDDVSVEQRARAMGWKPLAEFRGPPHLWCDAATFIARGEQELPVLREQSRRMSEKLARQEREMERLRASTQEALELAKRADDAGYQRALRELKERQREAVSNGDTDTYDEVAGEIERLQAARVAAAPVTPPAAEPEPQRQEAPAAPQVDPVIAEFVTRNAGWFNDAERPELKATMIAMHKQVIAERTIPDLRDQLAEAKNRVAQRFPEHADLGAAPAPRRASADPAPRAAGPAPTRGAAPPSRGVVGSQFNRIPAGERAEAQAAFERQKNHDPGLTEGEYVDLYLDPHADVLALRRKHRK